MYKFNSITNFNFSDTDCGTEGVYFITVNTSDMNTPLAEIKNGKHTLTKAGQIVERTMLAMEKHFLNLSIEAYVIMPNHVHLILQLSHIPEEALIVQGVSRFEMSFGLMVGRLNPFLIQGSVFHAINWFKASSLIELRKNDFSLFMWKSGYFDYPITNETSYKNIKSYIVQNPTGWDDDIDHPNNNFRSIIYHS
jgi:REP element-mobilizing transposase RayT